MLDDEWLKQVDRAYRPDEPPAQVERRVAMVLTEPEGAAYRRRSAEYARGELIRLVAFPHVARAISAFLPE
jgi:hypothetical protein